MTIAYVFSVLRLVGWSLFLLILCSDKRGLIKSTDHFTIYGGSALLDVLIINVDAYFYKESSVCFFLLSISSVWRWYAAGATVADAPWSRYGRRLEGAPVAVP